jgi:hypothetical protein
VDPPRAKCPLDRGREIRGIVRQLR